MKNTENCYQTLYNKYNVITLTLKPKSIKIYLWNSFFSTFAAKHLTDYLLLNQYFMNLLLVLMLQMIPHHMESM